MSLPKPNVEKEMVTISDDESTSDQPPAKIPKRDPIPLSPTEVQLRQQIDELKKQLKVASDAAAASNVAKEAAETLLDSKRGILDGSNQGPDNDNDLQTRLADISKQLEDARNRKREAENREDVMARENDKLKMNEVKLKGEKSNAERQIKQLEHQISILNNKLKKAEDAKKKAEDAKKNAEDAKKEAENANNMNDAISLANAEFTGRSHLDVKKEDVGNPNEELLQENSKMKKELNEAKIREEAANNDKKLLEEEFETISRKLFEAQQREDVLEPAIVALKKKLDDLERKRSALKSELKRKNDDFEAKVAELDRIKRENETLKAELDESSAESEEEEDEKWISACLCGIIVNNGEPMIQCDNCKLSWEHVDCIFPRTKKAPKGKYYCHECKPRPTELTTEQAREYQDGIVALKNKSKEQGERSGVVEGNDKENTEPVRRSNRVVVKNEVVENDNETTVPVVLKKGDNTYSEKAKVMLSRSGLSSSLPSNDSDLLDVLSKTRAYSTKIDSNSHKLMTRKIILAGEYIAELKGYVSLQEECINRDLPSGLLNDHTFLYKHEGLLKLIIDSRKGGNFAKNIRRSCKPNAKLIAVMTGSTNREFHFMIKAKEEMKYRQEITIKLEDDWKAKPKPAQGCGCEDKQTCEMEIFFNQITQNAAASSNESSK